MTLSHSGKTVEPHDDNDESDDADEGKGLAVERFGFLREDRHHIQELIAGVRRALKRKSVTPQQICGLGKLLHGLQRLPLPTPGINISVTIGSRTGENLFYQSVELSESSFELSSGGAEYTPGVGSDSHTSFSFLVEVGGFRDNCMFTEIEDWISGFIKSLCDEDQALKVDDEDEGLALDWHEEAVEDDWDQLDSEH